MFANHRPLIAILLTLLLAAGSGSVCADNIFQKLTGRGGDKQSSDSIATVETGSKQQKKKGGKKGKKSQEEEVDPYSLSLDDNLTTPAVAAKQKPTVAAYMGEIAKQLAQRKVARIETMRAGEVVVATIGTDLLFAPNDTVLRPTAPELLSPYRSLLSRGLYKFVLACHTDNTGSTLYTDRLSEARAAAVDSWLTRDLTATDAVLVPYALGAAEPLHPNDSQAHRAANRRIEIFIVPSQQLIDLAQSGKLPPVQQ